MEIRKPKLFMVLTGILIVGMVATIVAFSHHPMGADFTTYKEIGAGNLNDFQSLVGMRVAVRGKVTIEKSENLIQLPGNIKVISFILKRNLPALGKVTGHTEYVEFKTSPFIINVGGKNLPVIGQPEQVEDPEGRIISREDPNLFWDTIRENQEYSIFGVLQIDNSGTAFLLPYRVSSFQIKKIQEQAMAENRKVSFIQYIVVFIIVIVYLTSLWWGGIVGSSQDEIEKINKPCNPNSMEG